MNPIKNKIRLYIEYLALALLLALLGLSVTLKMQTYRQEISITNLAHGLNEANNELEVISRVSEAQEKVIQSLSDQRVKDNEIVGGLLDTYDRLRKATQVVKDRLDTLEKTDEEVKAYFDYPIPDSVGCLYDDSCAENGGKNGILKSKPPGGIIAPLLLAPEKEAVGGETSDKHLP